MALQGQGEGAEGRRTGKEEKKGEEKKALSSSSQARISEAIPYKKQKKQGPYKALKGLMGLLRGVKGLLKGLIRPLRAP